MKLYLSIVKGKMILTLVKDREVSIQKGTVAMELCNVGSDCAQL